MNLSKKYIIIAFLALSHFACNKEIDNQKTETVHIYGNCNMCKSTIEDAGNINGVSSVEWNKDTKKAIIIFLYL